MRFVLSLLLFLISGQASSGTLSGLITGNQIYDLCGDIDIIDATQSVESAYCLGYITGGLEGIRGGATLIVVAAKDGGMPERDFKIMDGLLGYCHPDGVSTMQYINVFMKYLREHPEVHHKPARTLMLNSWRIAFPCE